jgi:hypothetical protein
MSGEILQGIAGGIGQGLQQGVQLGLTLQQLKPQQDEVQAERAFRAAEASKDRALARERAADEARDRATGLEIQRGAREDARVAATRANEIAQRQQDIAEEESERRSQVDFLQLALQSFNAGRERSLKERLSEEERTFRRQLSEEERKAAETRAANREAFDLNLDRQRALYGLQEKVTDFGLKMQLDEAATQAALRLEQLRFNGASMGEILRARIAGAQAGVSRDAVGNAHPAALAEYNRTLEGLSQAIPPVNALVSGATPDIASHRITTFHDLLAERIQQRINTPGDDPDYLKDIAQIGRDVRSGKYDPEVPPAPEEPPRKERPKLAPLPNRAAPEKKGVVPVLYQLNPLYHLLKNR